MLGNDEATSDTSQTALEVSIAAGAETIRVEVDRSGLLISNGSRWDQRLTREEAWRLAEAIDSVATAAGRDD